MAWAAAGLIALGFIVGGFGTLIGAGGGFLLVPVLALLYPRDEPATLTGISLLVVAANALSGSLAYTRMGRVDFRAGLWFAAAAVPGAVLGAWATTFISRRVFEGLLGSLMMAGAVLLLARSHRAAAVAAGPESSHGLRASAPDAAPQPGDPARRPAAGDRRRLVRGMMLSFLVGVVSSLLGIGGGILHVPLLVEFLGYPVHVATATSHFVLAVTGWAGVAVHAWAGTYQHGLRRAALLAAGVIPGAQLGALLSRRVDDRWILRALAIALLLAGARVLAMGGTP